MIEAPARAVVLGQKLVQLTMPGVPDVYQGCELLDQSLVDPDNRRPVDFAARRALLAELDAGTPPRTLPAEKLLVTSRALRARRDHPEAFRGPEAGYTPLATTTGNAVAFARGGGDRERVVSVITRMPLALERRGGWGEHTVSLPPGRWRDALGGPELEGGAYPLADLLAHRPVALLVR